MQKFKFDYDKEHDDLFLFNPNSKSKASIEFGDIILDYNSKKELVGIQLINASKTLKELGTERETTVIENVLNNMKECQLDIMTKNNFLVIKLHLISKTNEIQPVILVPNIRQPSPSLAYAWSINRC